MAHKLSPAFSMKFLNGHILAIGRLFVLVFFLANSGFTVVFSHCTMQDMDCCTTPEQGMSGACGMMDPPQPSGGLSVTAGDDCQKVIVAGGLTVDPTVVEKESAQRVVRVELFAAFTADLEFSPVSSQLHEPCPSASQNVSPPSVETYILNSSFLI